MRHSTGTNFTKISKNGIVYAGAWDFEIIGITSDSTRVILKVRDSTKWFHEVGYEKRISRKLYKDNTFNLKGVKFDASNVSGFTK